MATCTHLDFRIVMVWCLQFSPFCGYIISVLIFYVRGWWRGADNVYLVHGFSNRVPKELYLRGLIHTWTWYIWRNYYFLSTFWTCFLSIKVWAVEGLFSFWIASFTFIPISFNSFKTSVDFFCISCNPLPLNKSHTHKSLQNKPSSTLGSPWGYCGTRPLKSLEILFLNVEGLQDMLSISLKDFLFAWKDLDGTT